MAKEEHDESKKVRRQEGRKARRQQRWEHSQPQLYKAVGTLTSRWRTFGRILISGPRHTALAVGLAAIERTKGQVASSRLLVEPRVGLFVRYGVAVCGLLGFALPVLTGYWRRGLLGCLWRALERHLVQSHT
jgi:hypothetical protein